MNQPGGEDKTEAAKRGIKIFLQFAFFIGLLAAFNLYNYFRTTRKMFLVVGVVCVVFFIGWVLFYFLYVRKGRA